MHSVLFLSKLYVQFLQLAGHAKSKIEETSYIELHENHFEQSGGMLHEVLLTAQSGLHFTIIIKQRILFNDQCSLRALYISETVHRTAIFRSFAEQTYVDSSMWRANIHMCKYSCLYSSRSDSHTGCILQFLW